MTIYNCARRGRLKMINGSKNESARNEGLHRSNMKLKLIKDQRRSRPLLSFKRIPRNPERMRERIGKRICGTANVHHMPPEISLHFGKSIRAVRGILHIVVIFIARAWRRNLRRNYSSPRYRKIKPAGNIRPVVALYFRGTKSDVRIDF